MENIFKIAIGDPSKDGHNQCEYVTITCNKTKEQVYEAYNNSCDLTGLVFTNNKNPKINGEEIKWQHPEYNDRLICVEYESSEVSELAQRILKSFGIQNTEVDADEGVLLDLFMDFIKLSLPDMEWDVIHDDIETLNLTIGYGLFE